MCGIAIKPKLRSYLPQPQPVIVVALLVPAVLGELVLLLLCLLVLAILALLLLTVLALILLGHGVLRFSAHRTALMVLRVRKNSAAGGRKFAALNRQCGTKPA
ncbi:MAG: hypothetical protein ACLSFT_06230 [Ruminococcus callidus]